MSGSSKHRSRRLTRHQIATAIRKRNAEAVAAATEVGPGGVAIRNTDPQATGHVQILVTVGTEDTFEAFYGDGEELVSEAYREAIVAMGKRIKRAVTMHVQYHPHDAEVTDCDCGIIAGHASVWRNAAAEQAEAKRVGTAVAV